MDTPLLDYAERQAFARQLRLCWRCLAYKPLGDFYIDRGEPLYNCKPCHVALVCMSKESRKAEYDAREKADAEWFASYPEQWRDRIGSYFGDWPKNEEWAPIPGYIGTYEASSKGRIRSLWVHRHKRLLRRPEPRVLCTHTNPLGYISVTLVARDTRKHLTKNVHSLVCSAFRGPKQPGMVCGHNDGNPSNNCIENLHWITYTENEADKKRHGRNLAGSKNHQAKLTEEQVVEMIRLYSSGTSPSAIARKFEVSKSVAHKIVTRQAWKHVG